METISQASSGNLPIELVFLIVKYAAEPTFAQPDQYEAKNPYSTARTLCLVSRAVRRIALPEMLHTVLLGFHNVTAFVHALSMQKAYAQKNPGLCLAYTRHIRNIWIGKFCVGPELIPEHSSFGTSVPESAIDLFAPVLLAAPSLAIDFSSMDLLTCCVDHAWTRMSKDIDRECLPPPWSTKTLTISGMVITPWRITALASRSAFLASVAHLIVLSHTESSSNLHVIRRAAGTIGPRDYNLPRWMTHAPWASFKKLETISLVFPHVKPPLDVFAFSTGMDLPVELLTFPASLVKGHRVPLEIKASTETGEGHISLNDVRVVVSDFQVHFCVFCHEWDKVWARIVG
ncbi:hypothetical protein EV702DRAFT_239495 [Suillus placidus]|uniref:Uncharacterized protein n=1 Tax=Suillus placidus TaxID=48579 RepID=A0A9P7A7E5_9AGAM|nr:hypothetical protein EV702DRAFT_239495 [Suillus placidus]